VAAGDVCTDNFVALDLHYVENRKGKAMDKNNRDEVKILIISIPIMASIMWVLSSLNVSSELLRYTAIFLSCGAVYYITYKLIKA
jgi:hypothetical protein